MVYFYFLATQPTNQPIKSKKDDDEDGNVNSWLIIIMIMINLIACLPSAWEHVWA